MRWQGEGSLNHRQYAVTKHVIGPKGGISSAFGDYAFG